MIEIIAGAILAFFAIVGVAEIFRSLCSFLLRPQNKKITFLVASRGDDKQIEYVVRSLVFRAGLINTFYKNPCIVIIDQGMSEETKKICKLLSEETGCVEICRADELKTLLNRDFQI